MNERTERVAAEWATLFDLLRQHEELQVEDGDAFAQLAQRHGLAPLLMERLRGEPGPAVQECLAALDGTRERAIFDDLHLDAEAVSLFESFGEAKRSGRIGSLPLALKGVHLKRTIYTGQPHLRTMGDLDILVHERDERAVDGLLERLGFSPVQADRRSVHARWSHAITWFKRGSKDRVVRVDVHRNLTHLMRGAKVPEHFFGRSVQVHDDPPIFGLSDADLLAHLCVHLSHEFFRGPLKGLVDVDRLLRTLDLNASQGRRDLFWEPARPALSVTLAILSRRKAWDEGRPLFGVYPASGRRFERLFDEAQLFDGKKGRAQAVLNLQRALFLIDSPMRRLCYPFYLGAVQVSRIPERLSVSKNVAECPRPEGP